MGVHSNSLQVGGLTPGSDYDITVLSLLVSDFSQPVTTQFSTRKTHTHTQINLFVATLNVASHIRAISELLVVTFDPQLWRVRD
jgi:hypothetical protein